MGTESSFKEVVLFTGIIFNDNRILGDVKDLLQKEYSRIDIESDIINFDFTTYYDSEMGTPLFRQFVSFKRFVNPELLPDIKKFTNSVEKNFSRREKRSINLDPGYVSDANVIIATTKNHYHRVPLSKGIYAHIEYVFKGKKVHDLEWTYPDFKTEKYKEFFLKLLQKYKGSMPDLV